MKVNYKGIAMLVLIIAVMVSAVYMFSAQPEDEDVFTYSDLINLFKEDLVREFYVDGDSVITVYSRKPIRKDGNIIGYEQVNGEDVIEKNEYAFTDSFQ